MLGCVWQSFCCKATSKMGQKGLLGGGKEKEKGGEGGEEKEKREEKLQSHWFDPRLEHVSINANSYKVL